MGLTGLFCANKIEKLQKKADTKKSVGLIKKDMDYWVSDSCGYSTVFDALFLLVLVSLSGVVLLPALSAEEQYSAAGYTTGSELDSHILETLLTCGPEGFDYEISPFSVLNLTPPTNSVVESPSKALFGKEQKHRSFADLAAENLAFNLTFSGDGTLVCANPFARAHVSRTSETLEAHLDREFSGRYCYRFEAYWYPVEAFPLGSEIVIGKEAPVSAVRQSAKISMPPFTASPSKEALLFCVNDAVLENALNETALTASNETGKERLSKAFSESLDTAAEEGAIVVEELLFPSEYFGSVFGEEGDEGGESMQTLLYGVPCSPAGEEISENEIFGPEEAFLFFFADRLSRVFNPCPENRSENHSGNSSGNSSENLSEIPGNFSGNIFENTSSELSQFISVPDLSDLKALLHPLIKSQIREGLEAELSSEINATVSKMSESGNISELRVLRDAQIESIYRKINPGGARAVLCLWVPSS